MALGPKHFSAKHFAYMHVCMILSLLALWGYVTHLSQYVFLLLAVLSFYGALCFAFKALAEKMAGK